MKQSFPPGTLEVMVQPSVAAAIVPSCFLLAVLYIALAIVHPLALEDSVGITMSSLAGFSALSLIMCGVLWYRYRTNERAHLVMGLIALLVLINTSCQFFVVPLASNTSNYIIFILGVGVLVQSRYWLYPLLCCGLLSWFLVVYLTPINALGNWGWFLLISATVSVLLHEQRIAATKELALRELQLQSNARALNQLVRSEKLSLSKKQEMFEEIVLVAQAQLGAERISVWIFDLVHERLLEVAKIPDKLDFEQVEIVSIEDYFDALDRNRTIEARNVASDARFSGLADYLQRHRIVSKLDAGILVNGIVMGVVSVEQCLSERIKADGLRGREWTLEEQAFVASLADMAAIAIQAEERTMLAYRSSEIDRLESLGTFAGLVASDFSGLLDEIRVQSDLLQSQLSDALQQSRLNKVLAAEVKARALAEQLLSFSGQSNSIRQIYHLAQIVEDAVSEMTQAPGSQFQISSIEPDADLPVAVDVAQIRQVLNNLIENARESASTEVKIRMGRVSHEEIATSDVAESDRLTMPEYAWVEVNDNGKGMDAETLDRVFDPFFTTRPTNTGFGLAVANGIIRSHGGRIQAASKIGVGSRFRLLLPLVGPVANTDELVPAESTPGFSLPVGALAEATLTNDEIRSILLVDDDPMVSLITRRFLEAEGYEITAFDSLATAKAFFEAGELAFRCAILDLSLGDGSGEDLVPLIRKINPDLPIIVMSGDLSKASLLDDPVILYLPKPFEQPDLIGAVDKVTA